jgi:N-acetylmuramic acid 6-phosphate etherase
MVKSKIFQELSNLSTEARLEASKDIDLADSLEICRIINNEDKKCANAVESAIDKIANAVDLISQAFRSGGRLIYVGAGTSGRLGVLDASECPPTFGTDPSMVVALIAGGDIALRHAQEGSEDNSLQAVKDIQQLNLQTHDIICGIMASGRTPYVISALNFASSQGLKTIAIACNDEKYLKAKVDVAICVNAGPEVLSGSTRMKAGSMQKMILNMLSTASMIKIGKVYQNVMVDLQMNSNKLVERSKKIVMELCNVNYDEAELLLIRANYNVKLAIILSLTGKDLEDAEKILKDNLGVIRNAIK